MSAWIWMKCCVLTDVGTWTNWLTFEPDLDYSPDAGTGLLSPISYKRCYADFYVRKIPRIGGSPLQRGVVLKRFYSLWHRNTFVRGTCALLSALLVMCLLFTSDRGAGTCFCPCLSVCLSVSKITQKRMHGFGWNIACRQMSGHGRTD